MRIADDDSETDEDCYLYQTDESEDEPVLQIKKTNEDKPAEIKKERIIRTVDMCQNNEDLRIAVMNGNVEAVENVMSRGVNVNEVLKAGWTALLYACSRAHPHLVKYLLEQGANPNIDKDNYTALMAVCASNKEEDEIATCVTHLLQHGADVNVCEKHQITALMFAAKGGHEKVVTLLLDHGAQMNLVDSRGWTALSWATNYGHGTVVSIFINASGDLELLGHSNEIALQLAVENGYVNIAEALKSVQEKKKIEPAILHELQTMESKKPTYAEMNKGPQKIQKYGDLEMFLAGLQLSDLLPIFEENNITFQMCLTLTEDELIKIGVSKLGMRRQILNGIHEIHKKEWTRSSLTVLRHKNHISCPDAYATVANITKHLSYIQSTITYLRKQSMVNPEDLEMGKNDVTVSKLLDQAKKATSSAMSLQQELVRLREHLTNVERRIEHAPVGIINHEVLESNATTKKRSFKLFSICVLTTGLLGIAYARPNILGTWNYSKFVSDIFK